MRSFILHTVVAATGLALASAVQAANLEAGKKRVTEVCAACHGVDGNSQNPDYPRLGGQHPDYLAKALRDYQSGARNNAIMKAFATALNENDIADVSAWFARQPQVLSHRR